MVYLDCKRQCHGCVGFRVTIVTVPWGFKIQKKANDNVTPLALVADEVAVANTVSTDKLSSGEAAESKVTLGAGMTAGTDNPKSIDLEDGRTMPATEKVDILPSLRQHGQEGGWRGGGGGGGDLLAC